MLCLSTAIYEYAPLDSSRRESVCQPECQFDQSHNEDCNAQDNELSENKLCSLGRANFDYCAPRAYRNLNEVLSADCALARWRAGVLLRRGGHIDLSHLKIGSRTAAC